MYIQFQNEQTRESEIRLFLVAKVKKKQNGLIYLLYLQNQKAIN